MRDLKRQSNINKKNIEIRFDDDILGISFAEKNSSNDNTQKIQVIVWDFSNCDKSRIRTSKQVVSGLNRINEAFGINYPISKIYYVPSEDGSGSMYRHFTVNLLEHYHSGNEFREF